MFEDFREDVEAGADIDPGREGSREPGLEEDMIAVNSNWTVGRNESGEVVGYKALTKRLLT